MFKKVLRHNFREIIFVILAFFLMAAAAYFSVGHILRGRLLDRAREMISTAEANVRAGLSEAETVLLNTHNIVQNMVVRNASQQEILDYFVNTTEWVRMRKESLFECYGLYGFINDEFFDSMGLNPGNDYIPQTRPWYQTAMQSGKEIGYTTPYLDARTGDIIVSAVYNFFDNEDKITGVLAMDIEISWLSEYVGSLEKDSGGYGILVNQNMTILTHPDNSFMGMQLHNLGDNYNEITQVLFNGGEVLAKRIKDSNGKSVIIFFTRIFNGWSIGIVTPYFQFYKDLYIIGAILIFLGLVLSFLLCYMLLSLSTAKMRADEENRQKSSFLASMSHEIRTPMNAIVGMAELLLRGELSDIARSFAQDIKQAGNNLISIINDILDFSKIEAGKLEIIPVKYLLSSLINDTVNIIGMRLSEKQIQFNTNIDGNIPNNLIGDEVRIRQILLNLLSNAVKYTDSGYINFSVEIDRREDKTIWLKASVSDSGKGIKPEDLQKLFGNFVRIDTRQNQSIEGTGLGLAIVKSLCNAMGGIINVESEYGKGSTFTVIIPQIVESEELFSAEKTTDKKTDSSGVNSFLIPQTRILVVDDIPTNLILAEGLLLPYQANVDTCLRGANAVELVKQNNYDLVFMDHMMPEMNGIEVTAAIREWENEQEEQKPQIPIVMLTANTVSGMREMFLENGLSDFLAKPIDISKLDEIIDRWIPDEKKEKVTISSEQEPAGSSDDSVIPGINVKQGIVNTGGTIKKFYKVLNVLYMDLLEKMPLLKTMPDESTLKDFQIQVHAQKSAMAIIGANELSEKAAMLEDASKREDYVFIQENLPFFANQLTELTNNISKALESSINKEEEVALLFSSEHYLTQIKELAKALKTRNASDIDRTLEELINKPLENKIKQIVEQIAGEILMTEYDNALQIIENMLNNNNEQ